MPNALALRIHQKANSSRMNAYNLIVQWKRGKLDLFFFQINVLTFVRVSEQFDYTQSLGAVKKANTRWTIDRISWRFGPAEKLTSITPHQAEREKGFFSALLMRRFEFFPCRLCMFFLTEKFSTRSTGHSLACLTRELYVVLRRARSFSSKKSDARVNLSQSWSHSIVCMWPSKQMMMMMMMKAHTEDHEEDKTRQSTAAETRPRQKANDASHVIAVLRSWAGRETRKKRDEQTIRWTSKNKSPDETYSH